MKIVKLIPVLAVSVWFTACSGSQEPATTQDETTQESTETTETQVAVDHPTEFTVKAIGNTMPEMQFDVDRITLNAGKEITITLVNEGDNETMMHNLVVIYNGYAEEVANNGMMQKDNGYIDPEDPAIIAASPMSGPGETVSFTFTIDDPGTYQFVCTYPGHWSRMLGTIVAE